MLNDCADNKFVSLVHTVIERTRTYVQLGKKQAHRKFSFSNKVHLNLPLLQLLACLVKNPRKSKRKKKIDFEACKLDDIDKRVRERERKEELLARNIAGWRRKGMNEGLNGVLRRSCYR